MLIILFQLKILTQMVKILKLKSMIESELLSITIFLVKATLKIGQDKSLLMILFCKPNPWTHKVEDSNGEKVIGSFYEKELLWSIL